MEKCNLTKQQKIELLQDQVRHNRIEKNELENKCKEWELDLWENIFFPIGYNTCDRCRDYGDSRYDFCWIDSVDWDIDNLEDKAIMEAIYRENVDYCAVCWHCLNELREIGKKWLEQN